MVFVALSPHLSSKIHKTLPAPLQKTTTKNTKLMHFNSTLQMDNNSRTCQFYPHTINATYTRTITGLDWTARPIIQRDPRELRRTLATRLWWRYNRGDNYFIKLNSIVSRDDFCVPPARAFHTDSLARPCSQHPPPVKSPLHSTSMPGRHNTLHQNHILLTPILILRVTGQECDFKIQCRVQRHRSECCIRIDPMYGHGGV